MKRILGPGVVLACIVLAVGAARPAPPCDETAVRRDLGRIEARTGGVLALAAQDVATGARLSFHGEQPVFMSSVVKLPLAVRILRQVDRGRLDLDARVTIPPTRFAPGFSPLADSARSQTIVLTIAELLRHAVSNSDNTASDALMELAGGPAAVTAEMRALGIAGIRADRTYRQNSAAFRGVDSLPPRWTLAEYDALSERVPAPRREAAPGRFLADPRDRATPEALVRLLAALERGRALSPAGTRRLMRLMTQTANPATRIVAGLPAGFTAAHKTGTWGGGGVSVAVNDVGLIRPPDRGAPLALAVMVRASTAPDSTVDAAIAEATRRVVDAWRRGEAVCTAHRRR
ncbi:MAG TPA: class A beta-lactamase [Longimicrobium sp.]|jgi:beta-lactamase class A|nr:class A beta-lactamase [Longimicrobium sp.]